jgi:hypothetical protein
LSLLQNLHGIAAQKPDDRRGQDNRDCASRSHLRSAHPAAILYVVTSTFSLPAHKYSCRNEVPMFQVRTKLFENPGAGENGLENRILLLALGRLCSSFAAGRIQFLFIARRKADVNGKKTSRETGRNADAVSPTPRCDRNPRF